MATIAALIVISLVVLLHVVVTVMLTRSDFEISLQKTLQLALVWIVPCVGSIIVIAVLRGAHSDCKPRFASDSAINPGLPGTDSMSDSYGVTMVATAREVAMPDTGVMAELADVDQTPSVSDS
jgi:hypothetical protein